MKTIETGRDCKYSKPDANDFTEANGTMTRVNEIRYSKQLDMYYQKQENLDKQKMQTFSLFLGQMDDEVRASAEEHPDWKVINEDKSLLRILEVLQSTSHYYKSTLEPISALMTLKGDMMRIKQGKYESIIDYRERFDGMVEVCESHGINVHEDSGVLVVIA